MGICQDETQVTICRILCVCGGRGRVGVGLVVGGWLLWASKGQNWDDTRLMNLCILAYPQVLKVAQLPTLPFQKKR